MLHKVSILKPTLLFTLRVVTQRVKLTCLCIGLEYLHTGCTPPIIHRNVKCTNVFLDENFNAKLGGFGLSRAFDAAEGSHMNTAIAGTPGYVDPE